LEKDSGAFPFTDLDLLDILKTIIKTKARIKIDKLENLRKFKTLRKKNRLYLQNPKKLRESSRSGTCKGF